MEKQISFIFPHLSLNNQIQTINIIFVFFIQPFT